MPLADRETRYHAGERPKMQVLRLKAFNGQVPDDPNGQSAEHKSVHPIGVEPFDDQFGDSYRDERRQQEVHDVAQVARSPAVVPEVMPIGPIAGSRWKSG